MQKSRLFRAAIPGENLTVNGKNYPWHRPPQYAQYDDAFEFFTDDVLGNPDRLSSISMLVSNGVSALAVTQTLLIQSVGAGKISPDMSLLIAGPVYKTLTKILDALNVRYLSGYDTPEEMASFLKYIEGKEYLKDTSKSKYKLTKDQEAEMERITEEAMAEIPEGGLMGAPTGDQERIEIPMEESKGGLVQKEADMEEGEA